ncbi:MAG TPA: hypothetical protein VHD84_03010, partial [Candidatus Saccharimonadales bacterium]|nr:hypothetical protein [Candidatus Saccharimonadales bacterium]
MKFAVKSLLLLYTLAVLSGALLPFMSQSAAADSANLIANPSVETVDPSQKTLPQGWAQDEWGSNKPTFSYLSTGHDSDHSVKVQMSNYSSGDAKWYFTPVAVNSGTNYNYSDYYEATVQTDVVAQFDDGAGNYTYQDLGTAEASSSWHAYTADFVVPSGIKNVTVLHVIAANGTLTTDDFSLTATAATPPPTDGNLVANSSMETANPNNKSAPQDWLQDEWGTNKPTFSYLNTGHTGSHSVQVQMKNYSSGDAKWYFTPVAVNSGTNYNYSD